VCGDQRKWADLGIIISFVAFFRLLHYFFFWKHTKELGRPVGSPPICGGACDKDCCQECGCPRCG